MGVPCSFQAYICLIPVFGNLNVDKILSSRASEWESLRWVRTRPVQKAVMQKFPGQPSSLLAGDNRLVSMSQIITACNFSIISGMLWQAFPKEAEGSQGVAASGGCSCVCHLLLRCHSWTVGGAGTLVFSGQALLHLASWTGKTISSVLELKRHLVCKQLS